MDYKIELQKYLVKRGISVNALSKELDMSREVLYRLLKGKTKLTYLNRARLDHLFREE